MPTYHTRIFLWTMFVWGHKSPNDRAGFNSTLLHWQFNAGSPWTWVCSHLWLRGPQVSEESGDLWDEVRRGTVSQQGQHLHLEVLAHAAHLRFGQSGWKVYWTQTQYKNTWDLASLGGRFTGHKHSATTPETWPEWVEGLLETNSTKTPETWPVWVEGSLSTNSAKTPETWLAWVEGLLAINSAKTPETWLARVEGSLATNTVQKHLSFGLVSGKFTGHRIYKHLRLSQCGWKVQWT